MKESTLEGTNLQEADFYEVWVNEKYVKKHLSRIAAVIQKWFSEHVKYFC